MVSTIDPTLAGDMTKDGRAIDKANLQAGFAAAKADIEELQGLTPSSFPVPVSEGGTGVATLTDGGILLGSGTGAVTAMSVLADGEVVIGDGTTDPVALAAFTSSTGALKHENGGIEADISAIADGGLLVGTGAGTMAIRASALTGGASGFLTHEVGGLEFDASAVADGDVIVGTGAGTMGLESGATFRATVGLAIGVDVQAFDADILKADTADVLTAGFAGTVHDAGTKSTGTYTPDEADGNLQKAVNGGAHTLAPPTNDCTIIVQYTNNAFAGTITTSGFTLVDGDSFDTTNGNDFFAFIVKNNGFSSLTVKALQ